MSACHDSTLGLPNICPVMKSERRNSQGVWDSGALVRKSYTKRTLPQWKQPRGALGRRSLLPLVCSTSSDRRSLASGPTLAMLHERRAGRRRARALICLLRSSMSGHSSTTFCRGILVSHQLLRHLGACQCVGRLPQTPPASGS